MNKKLVEYVFDIRGRVKITLEGADNEAKYELAEKLAVEKVAKEIDDNWIYDVTADEHTEFAEPEAL